MKYKLGDKIGNSGGFGEVFECISEKGEIFALKFLHDSLEKDDVAVHRFQKEMQTMQKLNHPNVIKIVTRVQQNEKIGYIMPEYVCNLTNVLNELGDNYRRQYTILQEILNGMIYLHSQGIIHRDLKPDNILYNSDTDIAISDLGLAKDILSDSSSLTRTGNVMGTIRYMSPEQQADSKNIDGRTDIYAFGKIMEDIVTGGLGYTTSMDGGISYIIEKCTSSRPEKRFYSFVDVKSAVDSVYQILLKIVDDEEYETELINYELWGGTISDIKKLAYHILSADAVEHIEKLFEVMSDDEMISLESDDSELFRKLVSRLTDYYISQAWPFAYTDTIGDLCYRLL